MNSQYAWYAEINVGTEASPSWTHIPQGILKNFNCSVDSTTKSGSGRFKVADKTGALWDVLNALDNKGVNQELRFYFGDKNNFDSVFGGYTNSILRPSRYLTFNVDHYMQLLTREISQDDLFQDKTGSEMVTTLIPKYFPAATAGVVPISIANYVDATGNQSGKEFEFNADNMNMMLALKQIASKTRKTSGVIPYDFYVNYDVANTEKALWFDVKNNFSSGLTLYDGSDFFGNYKLNEDTSRIINYWVVRGENMIPTPLDQDMWTEYDDDSDVQDVWGDVRCTAEYDTADHAGSYSVRADVDSGEDDAYIYLKLDDEDAFDATLTPAAQFRNNYGYIFNTFQEQWLVLYIQVIDPLLTRIQNNEMAIGFWFDVADADGNAYSIYPVTNQPQSVIHGGDNSNVDTGTSWIKREFRLKDHHENIDFQYIEQIGIQVIATNGYTLDSGDDFSIDGLHFENRGLTIESDPAGTPIGTDSTSIAAYGRRKAILNDRSITKRLSGTDPDDDIDDGYTKQMCNNIANRLVGYTANPSLSLTAQLKRYQQISPMYTFNLYIPDRNILNESYRAQSVSYSPAGQTIYAKPAAFYDDTNYDLGALVSYIRSQMNESSRR